MWKLKLLENKFFPFIFFFISFTAFSQNRISGSVRSSKNEKLAFANVTVYDDQGKSLITYAISDENGEYSLNVPDGIYLFKVSYLGYKQVYVKKQVEKDIILDFILEEDEKALDEVVVKAKSLEAHIQNDTVKYNIKQIKTGKEVNLKDILEKLPGIEVDGNGKILANGKKIDKLLIDGKSFFGDQHQLATENISAEMVEGISLLNNYKDISDLDNREKSGKTAMNIEIGEEYKGRLHGNVSIAAGFVKKYEVKTNLFSFGQKTNLYFIGSANNLGNQTFTIEDYIHFMGIEKFISDNSGSMDLSEDDFLYYLIPNPHVKRKEEQSVAINFSYLPSNKFKLNTYIILNRNNIVEAQKAKQTFITNTQNVILNLENYNDNIFLINNSYLNATYKPTKKSVIDYSINFSPQKHHLKEIDNFDVKNYNTNRDNRNYNLSQVLNYKRQMGKYLLNSSLYSHIKNNDKALDIFSNESFLGLIFQGNNYTAAQYIKRVKSDWGVITAFSRKIAGIFSLKVYYKLSESQETFRSEVKQNQLNNDLKINTLENAAGLNFYKKQKAFFNYNLGMNYSWIQINGKRIFKFLPSVNLKFTFKTLHYLSLSYKKSLKWPQADNLVKNSYIASYNALINNQNVELSLPEKSNNYDLTYHISDLFSGTDFTLNASYSLARDIITTNTLTYPDYRVNRYYGGDYEKAYDAYINFRKKFSKIPFVLKLKSIFSSNKQNYYINGDINRINSSMLSNNLMLSSRFKKSFFDFEMGYKRKQREIKGMNRQIKNILTLNKPYLNLFFNFKKLSLKIDNSFVSYKSNIFSRETFEVSPIFNYETRKWTFYIKGKNILNLNHNYIIENAFYDNYIEEKIVSTMTGYILTGFQYRF